MISSVIPEILVLYTIFEQFGPKSAHISPTKTRNVSAVCQLPASVKSNEQATLAFQKHNSATSHKDKITERRQVVWKFWCGSCSRNWVRSAILEFSSDVSLQRRCILFKLRRRQNPTCYLTWLPKMFNHHCNGFLLFLRRSIFHASVWIWKQLISLSWNFLHNKLGES